ncbi:hypothetical protein, partial [Halarchaeum acidiphilum]|uniref:hypothetical protein n=1 Tax=Halarchaeum acidiphilum TaxID=489138 RepID=UPI0005D22257
MRPASHLALVSLLARSLRALRFLQPEASARRAVTTVSTSEPSFSPSAASSAKMPSGDLAARHLAVAAGAPGVAERLVERVAGVDAR